MVGRGPRPWVAAVVLSLLAGLVVVLPWSSAPPSGERSVAGQALAAAPAVPDPERTSVGTAAAPVWPAAQRVTVDLPAEVP
jgi:hypothetical protein